MEKAYDDFEFHVVFHSLHNFCAVDMSSFYLDILKDRLYTAKTTSIERRSGQTAMHAILSSMVRLMAPVLSFTADEVWSYMKESAGATRAYSLPLSRRSRRSIWTRRLRSAGTRILAVRGEAAKVLEALRRDKKIGHSLDAGVTLYAAPELATS